MVTCHAFLPLIVHLKYILLLLLYYLSDMLHVVVRQVIKRTSLSLATTVTCLAKQRNGSPYATFLNHPMANRLHIKNLTNKNLI